MTQAEDDTYTDEDLVTVLILARDAEKDYFEADERLRKAELAGQARRVLISRIEERNEARRYMLERQATYVRALLGRRDLA